MLEERIVNVLLSSGRVQDHNKGINNDSGFTDEEKRLYNQQHGTCKFIVQIYYISVYRCKHMKMVRQKIITYMFTIYRQI